MGNFAHVSGHGQCLLPFLSFSSNVFCLVVNFCSNIYNHICGFQKKGENDMAVLSIRKHIDRHVGKGKD